MSKCPCGSGREYADCCGAVIEGRSDARTAEALMRSRFSAFVMKETAYLESSLHPKYRADHDREATQRWADNAEWEKLQIVDKEAGGEADDTGTVEFIAAYRQDDTSHSHHEVGRFRRHKGRWYYTDGKTVAEGPRRNEGPKVGRNDPCPCGSGKKYKKCCGK